MEASSWSRVVAEGKGRWMRVVYEKYGQKFPGIRS